MKNPADKHSIPAGILKRPAKRGLILSHASLQRIFQSWHVECPSTGLILFALRGCLPVATVSGWRKDVELRLVPVDYTHMRCTLGIWNPRTGKVFAAPGSTVPFKDNVLRAATRKGKMKGKGVNQLESGFYLDLVKGEHLQGKRNGHQALRQSGYRFYRRSPKGLPFNSASPLGFGNPYDNLHCAWNLDTESPGFSSAGCLVVAGLPHCPRRESSQPNQGPWKMFHDLVYGVSQKSFPLLLLVAKDVRQVLTGKARRTALMYGSSGDAVIGLQKKLAAGGFYRGKITGKLDVRTYRAWNKAGF